MGRPFATTIASLEPGHIADLRKLMENPNHALPPIRRRMFLRLQLIAPCKSQPRPTENKKYARRQKRPYELTELGRQKAVET